MKPTDEEFFNPPETIVVKKIRHRCSVPAWEANSEYRGWCRFWKDTMKPVVDDTEPQGTQMTWNRSKKGGMTLYPVKTVDIYNWSAYAPQQPGTDGY